MRAFVVSVDYAQELAVSLPRNARHFEEVWVVSSPGDLETQRVALGHGARLFLTDAFTRGGAELNKFLALEECLDAAGRRGWLCLLDADTLWPSAVPDYPREAGYLYTPRRRMFTDLSRPVPEEKDWWRLPLHPVEHEWSGYSQVFHAGDEHLGPPPWHDVRIRHAGTGDSLFQMRWPAVRKVRPPFEVLHLGEAGVNWLGRASVRPDGTVPEGAGERRAALREMIRRRRPGPDRFKHERLE
jgi:hypothetical protein